ncbi:type II 3-dehydroquinate dehydratase [Conchiformibius steedae DSM 2580]|uniref:3-dehydroquinate dehydratase n=2 Tax=Conchiformibius steedae TaxID=153493 RepID=A0A3P2A725_9NEIS|nr:type II 3-dehydroquinate dehydratase [Conchiformibius steedae]QMT32704.1 type II 3-dehydroquinate dehydratase [Conchiformibius steedae]RRD91184.1 type II 3-dehydroquinate dehydratase [Conchiformibius steedae]URD67313.1 type II 3-dehydroquinate dehydratase [Conchiformibius steedae DSM 2580]
MAHIAVLNGPNLNLLGLREPHLYGSQSLEDIVTHLNGLAEASGFSLSHAQHNGEGDLVSAVQALRGRADMIILNAGAYTHTSIALRDALTAVCIPFVEVHISNVYAREPFRHHSYLSDKALGVIAGLGTFGYEAALRFCMDYLKR